MSAIIGAVAISLMVVVLLIAIFSLAMIVIIPISRFVARRSDEEESSNL